jgi:hypothetical protein
MGVLNVKPQRLHAAIAAVAPIVGLSIGTSGDNATVSVAYNGATPAQISAAAAALAAFDWSDAADATFNDAREPDLSALRDQAQAALDANTTYLAIGTPTNAQVAAQVRALTQQNQRIIRAVARLVLADL